MSAPSRRYATSLALLTDLYQLTMAHGYFKTGVAEREASFSLFFRSHPFRGGYTIAAGLADVVDWLEHFGFTDEDVHYLAGLRGSDGGQLFDDDFLGALRRLSFDWLSNRSGFRLIW